MPDPHRPLREDVRLLGELLGDALRAHEGTAIFEIVERIRGLSKEARSGNMSAFRQLADELAGMPLEAVVPVARAFSAFLGLANIAEQHHRIRRRRDYQRDPKSRPQRASADDGFQRLVEAGIGPDRLFDAIRSLRLELVLTAHPTEVSRRTTVQRANRIAAALAASDRPDLTRPEREDVVSTLRREIEGGWGSREIRHHRPAPLDEVRSGLIVFEQSLWAALPAYARAVDRALQRHTGRSLPLDVAPVRFGSWIGGDRDGNPNITPDVTWRASLLARWVAANLYMNDVDALREELSLVHASEELRDRVGASPEPYRALLRGVRQRLRSTLAWIESSLDHPSWHSSADAAVPPSDAYVEAEALLDAAFLCHRSLVATGYRDIADGRVSDFVRRIVTFGMTLAPLDIRQEADRHTDALSAITRARGLGIYEEWDENRRIAFLVAARDADDASVPPNLDASNDVRDVLDTCRLIAAMPPGSLGAYVITMASRASDILAVEYLQRAAGTRSPLRVVPLFETSKDLKNAGAVLDALLSIESYRQRIRGRQEVMVGYSDSAKDMGRFAAAWDLFRAQETIVEVCHRHGIQVTLFHGRGGSVGRGGGPTHLALMSQPPGSVDGALRVTEQGEMIQALFGLPDIAQRTMEVYTTGTLEAWLTPAAPARPEWRSRMERLADAAREAFRSTVYDDPEFIPYFRAATPERELSGMNIGSRPARRRSDDSIGSLRAIPWQFAWTQTRLMLGAWLGVERALGDAVARGERDELRTMYREWPHFRSLIQLMEMVLAKADARIAAEYDRRLVPAHLQPLGERLRRHLALAISSVLDITGHEELLEDSPVIRRSIDVRNPYVDPLNLLQVEMLGRVRDGGDERARAALMVTINGVAAGLRNTG